VRILDFHSNVCIRSLKHREITSVIAWTDVDAPGDAPSNAAIDPSLAVTISVPNSSLPPFL